MQILDRKRIAWAKRAFSTRRVPSEAIKTIVDTGHTPKAGDLVLARVVTLGTHKKIELQNGRRAAMYPGDEIIVAYGDRYAPDQFEAYVPDNLGTCHLVAAGGLASHAVSWHDKLSGPTVIEPIGLLGCAQNNPLNLADFAIAKGGGIMPRYVFGVFGTSMNAGKTTTAAALVKGLTNAGYRVGAVKVTGTAAGGDLWLMRDFGAIEALDFTDAGFASTFNVASEKIQEASVHLLRHLASGGCDVAVVEIADGLFQTETAELAQLEAFKSLLTGTFFAAGDAMGAVSGAKHLIGLGHNLLGLSGAFTRSPLGKREAESQPGPGVYGLNELVDPQTVVSLTGVSDGHYTLASGQ